MGRTKKSDYIAPEPRLISKEGYEKIINKINDLDQKIIEATRRLTETKRETREITDSAIGSCQEEVEFLKAQLRGLREELINTKEVNIDSTTSQNMVEVNDTVDLALNYGEEQEEVSLLLIDTAPENEGEMSVYSPIGKAIYHHSIGEEILYKIENSTNQNKVTILNITKPKKLAR